MELNGNWKMRKSQKKKKLKRNNTAANISSACFYEFYDLNQMDRLFNLLAVVAKEKKKNPKGWNSKSIWSYNPSARGLFLLSFDFLSALFWVSVDPLPFAGGVVPLNSLLISSQFCAAKVAYCHSRNLPTEGKKVGGERERTESGHKAGNKRGPKRTVCCARMASWVKMGKRKLEGNKDFSSFLYQCCVKCRWKGKKIKKKKEGIKLCTQVTRPFFTISRRSSFLSPPVLALSLSHTEAGTKIRRWLTWRTLSLPTERNIRRRKRRIFFSFFPRLPEADVPCAPHVIWIFFIRFVSVCQWVKVRVELSGISKNFERRLAK